jgi:hypothetical protein
MSRRRVPNGIGQALAARAPILIGVLVVAAALLVAWRLGGQVVNVVVVNSSGQPATFSWQPALFASAESKAIGGCESTSIELRAGETWHLSAANFETGSASVEVPLVAREVAFEVWLDATGQTEVASRVVDQPIDAPYPSGCAIVP